MPIRVTQCLECRRDTAESYFAGDQSRGIDLPVGQHVQGVVELQWGVAEHEAHVDFLAQRHRRPELIGAHAHPHDDHP